MSYSNLNHVPLHIRACLTEDDQWIQLITRIDTCISPEKLSKIESIKGKVKINYKACNHSLSKNFREQEILLGYSIPIRTYVDVRVLSCPGVSYVKNGDVVRQKTGEMIKLLGEDNLVVEDISCETEINDQTTECCAKSTSSILDDRLYVSSFAHAELVDINNLMQYRTLEETHQDIVAIIQQDPLSSGSLLKMTNDKNVVRTIKYMFNYSHVTQMNREETRNSLITLLNKSTIIKSDDCSRYIKKDTKHAISITSLIKMLKDKSCFNQEDYEALSVAASMFKVKAILISGEFCQEKFGEFIELCELNTHLTEVEIMQSRYNYDLNRTINSVSAFYNMSDELSDIVRSFLSCQLLSNPFTSSKNKADTAVKRAGYELIINSLFTLADSKHIIDNNRYKNISVEQAETVLSRAGILEEALESLDEMAITKCHLESMIFNSNEIEYYEEAEKVYTRHC